MIYSEYIWLIYAWSEPASNLFMPDEAQLPRNR
jgi:hypothetical protein